MKVVDKDKVISGLLRDELKRCREMQAGLQKSMAGLPKGVLNKLEKRYKEKAYSYYSLKFRDVKKVINKHIPNNQALALLEKLEQRKNLKRKRACIRRKSTTCRKS